eukprot:1137138-Pelagomonas_calceolata.AAC.2
MSTQGLVGFLLAGFKAPKTLSAASKQPACSSVSGLSSVAPNQCANSSVSGTFWRSPQHRAIGTNVKLLI